jgi:hypothetical protein
MTRDTKNQIMTWALTIPVLIILALIIYGAVLMIIRGPWAIIDLTGK